MSGKQVQMFIPLFCRQDTTQLGAEIQTPTSSPAHCAQLAASVAAGGGDKDLVMVVMVVLDTVCHSDPLPWTIALTVPAGTWSDVLGEGELSKSGEVGAGPCEPLQGASC